MVMDIKTNRERIWSQETQAERVEQGDLIFYLSLNGHLQCDGVKTR